MVGKNCFLVTKSKTSVTLEAPIYIGSSILQFAKIRQYRYHYYLAKPSGSDFPREYLDEVIRKFITPEEYEIVLKSRKVIKSVTLAYTDTDSLHYEVVMNVKDISFNELVSEYVLSGFMGVKPGSASTMKQPTNAWSAYSSVSSVDKVSDS